MSRHKDELLDNGAVTGYAMFMDDKKEEYEPGMSNDSDEVILKGCPIPECGGKAIVRFNLKRRFAAVYCESCHLTAYSKADWQALPRRSEALGEPFCESIRDPVIDRNEFD